MGDLHLEILPKGMLNELQVQYNLKDQIHNAQLEYPEIWEIPVWKWESISMDFIVGLPQTPKGHGSIWVIIDQLTKVAHFIAVRNDYRVEKLADLYIEHILRLHGAPTSIVSDRGTQYVSKFWRSLHKAIGIQLDYSTAYHPQIDGQTERVNQILEDML
jgi:hypothetical protein